MPPTGLGTKLPYKLLEELKEQEAASTSRNRALQTSPKDGWKAARAQQKTRSHAHPPPSKRQKFESQARNQKKLQASDFADPRTAAKPPQSISKKPSVISQAASRGGHKIDEKRPRISKAVQRKLVEDEEEIAVLESKLRLKKRKRLPKDFEEDGLTELLEGLEDGSSDVETRREQPRAEARHELEQNGKATQTKTVRAESHWRGLQRSQKHLDVTLDSDVEAPALRCNFVSSRSRSGIESVEAPDRGSDVDMENDSDGSTGKDDFNRRQNRVRENPYVAPLPRDQEAFKKYIPPALRKPSASDSEALLHLKRQTQGLVNRLTDATVLPILEGIEKLYRENARQCVTDILIDILLTAICESVRLPETLVVLYAGFIAALYKVVGTDFGTQVVQRITELFDHHYEQTICQIRSAASKEILNLMTLLCAIYNFQVIRCNLVFDYIKMLLSTLSEVNAELLVRIMQASGPRLRHDSPSSIQEMAFMLRSAVASIGGENLNFRTKFLIESINDFKDKRVKARGVASVIHSEHVTRMKKTLGCLSNRSIKGSEPLRIGLQDINEIENRGKWWLVGASWSDNGHSTLKSPQFTQGKARPEKDATYDSTCGDASQLLQLARELRMNTDIRRSIFISLVSASDYQDAYLRVTKLGLKRSQELEIPKVLLHCGGVEQSYNPYYTLVAKELCGDRRTKMAFQFCLWDLFKRMGESNDVRDSDHHDELDTRYIVNMAQMFGALVAEGALNLTILKHLDLISVQAKTKTFVEVMLVTLFIQSQRQSADKRDDKAIFNIISKVRDVPPLLVGLQYFLKETVSRSEIAGCKANEATILWACKVAGLAMESIG